jgi:Cu(I)/Ag(I) efflux system membrane fusion protein
MNRKFTTAIGAVAVAVAGIGGGYWFAMQRMTPGTNTQAAAPAPDGKKPLYWHDPMYPQQKFDKPGKSPFMDMPLVAVYADAGGNDAGVTISPRVVQNLGIRTVEARRAPLARKFEAVGAVAYDERAVSIVQARVSGYVEKLHVRAPLDPVTKGQPLADIVAPDWVAAQEEYLALRRMPQADESLRQAARQRLGVLGMPESTIAALDADAKPRPRVTVIAPTAGVVGELGAREGMTVMPGLTLFRINGLDTVWVNAEVPETQAAVAKPGNPVQATVPAFPGETFNGRIAAILPEVNAATRTLKARIELGNPGQRLKPGMFATVEFMSATRAEVVVVPTEALIRTGERTVVVVADTAKDGKPLFKPVDVEIGAESDGMTEIRKGVLAGTKVVVSGQFLIDSEASLKGTATRLGEASPAQEHRGEGKVEKISKQAVTLSHGPIPSMQWGPMTMDFKLPASGPPADLKEGAKVTFGFRQGKAGDFEITSIEAKK